MRWLALEDRGRPAMTELSDFDLTGKRALVTGGGDGLGLQMTEALVDAGATVVICGRRAEPLHEAARALGERVVPIAADVTSQDDVQRLVDAAGSIDILVNNAGLAHRAPWDEVTSQDWRWIMSLNVESPFWLIQALAPGMIERGWGRIINVSSIYGLVGGDHSRYPGSTSTPVLLASRSWPCPMARASRPTC